MNIALLLKPKMTVAYLTSDNTIRQGLEKMRHHGYTEIPVTDTQGLYLGTISEGDFLWYFYEKGNMDKKNMEEESIEKIINTKRSSAVRIDASTRELLYRATEQNFIPVVDDRNGFMGVVTRQDIIKKFVNFDAFMGD